MAATPPAPITSPSRSNSRRPSRALTMSRISCMYFATSFSCWFLPDVMIPSGIRAISFLGRQRVAGGASLRRPRARGDLYVCLIGEQYVAVGQPADHRGAVIAQNREPGRLTAHEKRQRLLERLPGRERRRLFGQI